MHEEILQDIWGSKYLLPKAKRKMGTGLASFLLVSNLTSLKGKTKSKVENKSKATEQIVCILKLLFSALQYIEKSQSYPQVSLRNAL